MYHNQVKNDFAMLLDWPKYVMFNARTDLH